MDKNGYLETFRVGLKILSESKDLVNDFGLMPNIKFKTLGGEVWWNNIVEENGWRIQRNSVTGHYRILDTDNVRHAWGSEKDVLEFFNKIVK